jgi:hypothetical protein
MPISGNVRGRRNAPLIRVEADCYLRNAVPELSADRSSISLCGWSAFGATASLPPAPAKVYLLNP